ncbi:hypothetical protein J7K52_02255 [Candidatus Bathyarchaeota archaeon]|nr:hypothetical protein [Candidatus Bathyarchaeota archaeon]
MVGKITRYCVPFSIPSSDRRRKFTKDMELAAIFCIAELHRKRGIDFILKRPAEEIDFIVQALYPFLLAPNQNKTLLFDGFGFISYSFKYDLLPSVETFINNLKRSAVNPQSYSATLMQYLDYFDSFTGVDKRTIKGLITDRDFINEFLTLFDKAVRVRKPIVDKIILSPSINEDTVRILTNEISEFRKRLQTDLNTLQKAMNLLNKLTERQLTKKQTEVLSIEKLYDKKISKTKEVLSKRAERIQSLFDKKIMDIGRELDKKIQDLHKERLRLQSRREELLETRAEYATKLKSLDKKKDSEDILALQESISEIDEKIGRLEDRVEEVAQKVDEISKKKRLEISRLSIECRNKIGEVMGKLDELEAEFKAKIKMREESVRSLQELTEIISSKINALLDLKKKALTEFEELGIEIKTRRITVVYVPFYIICFRRKSERRYVTIPTSMVESMGGLTKVKSLIGLSDVKSLLKPFPHIEELVNEFTLLLEENPVFEAEIAEAGSKLNILKSKSLRKSIKEGLKKLCDEEWFSENELSLLYRILGKYGD